LERTFRVYRRSSTAQLAAVRMLFDWLVTGGILATREVPRSFVLKV
jgi:hypothetical protein